MDLFARGPFNVGYEARFEPKEPRRRRVEKAQMECERAGLDALLVWKDENVRYITDLRPQIITGKSTSLNGALLIPGKESTILFCSGGERDRVERSMPWIKEVHTIPIIDERSLVEGQLFGAA